MNFIEQFTVTTEPGSQVTISGEIPFSEVSLHRAKALRALGKNIEIDGFRKGSIPESVLIQKVGTGSLLAEMAERAIALVYPKIIETHNIEAIGHPRIRITKLAPDNPLGFTATVAVLPPITLPDYKKVAAELNKTKETTEVTDADVEKQISDILRQKAAYERLQNKAQQTHTHADGTVHEGPAHDEADADHELEKNDPLPQLTDELVQSLGRPGQFTSVEDFKQKIKEHLAIAKLQEVNAAHRAKITDAIIEQSSFELPRILIETELQQMFGQMNSDLERANLSIDDYLGHIKKTREDLEREWTPAAEKRARLQLVLNEIAKKESIMPDTALVDAEVKNLLKQYEDADEARVRTYVASVLQNEVVMKYLEAA